MSATTGPSPACSVCTWVSVTLNGAFTLMCGAAVSVDPVTATLPVAPGSVHSGVPPLAGAAVGHVLAAAGAGVSVGVWVSVTENGSAGVVAEVELVDEAAESESEPHAASDATSNAAPDCERDGRRHTREVHGRHATER